MDHNLERLVDYVNKKNRESDRTVITPREVIEYYREQKMIDSVNAFSKTVRYIDDKFIGGE